MGLLTRSMDRLLYPDCGDNWDDVLLRDAILARLRPDAVVLDVGAGAGIVEQLDFRGRAARICGVDLDPRVVANPMLDEGRIADAASIPWDDESFDGAFADNVVEHLDDPTAVFAEIRRVLRPGGWFLLKTTNRRHYMPRIAAATPHWFHQAYNRLRGRAASDTFPTRYRANTEEDARRAAEAAGLAVASVRFYEGRPEYLRLTAPTYLLGAAWERAVNASDRLAKYRIVLLVELRRPGAVGAVSGLDT